MLFVDHTRTLMITSVLQSVMSAVLIYDQSDSGNLRLSNTADYITDYDNPLSTLIMASYLSTKHINCLFCQNKYAVA